MGIGTQEDTRWDLCEQIEELEEQVGHYRELWEERRDALSLLERPDIRLDSADRSVWLRIGESPQNSIEEAVRKAAAFFREIEDAKQGVEKFTRESSEQVAEYEAVIARMRQDFAAALEHFKK